MKFEDMKINGIYRSTLSKENIIFKAVSIQAGLVHGIVLQVLFGDAWARKGQTLAFYPESSEPFEDPNDILKGML